MRIFCSCRRCSCSVIYKPYKEVIPYNPCVFPLTPNASSWALITPRQHATTQYDWYTVLRNICFVNNSLSIFLSHTRYPRWTALHRLRWNNTAFPLSRNSALWKIQCSNLVHWLTSFSKDIYFFRMRCSADDRRRLPIFPEMQKTKINYDVDWVTHSYPFLPGSNNGSHWHLNQALLWFVMPLYALNERLSMTGIKLNLSHEVYFHLFFQKLSVRREPKK